MKEKPERKLLKELNLTDRFLFDEVIEDPQTHQDMLSIIFGWEIPLLTKNETEKEMRVSPQIRSVRMDVFSMDEEGTVYNTEMQDKRKSDLAKRSRYYQAVLDTNLLEPGIPNYNLLNTTYIILITTFDLFGYGKYQYTFEARCREEPGCVLEDQAVRIFLNTKGKNDSEVSEELVSFLHYIENTTDVMAENSGSERIKRIHNRVRKVKVSEEVGVKYMQAWEEKYYEREEGREEGRIEGREEGAKAKLQEQIRKKLEKGKSVEKIADELEESTEIVEKFIEEMEK
ncbi:MAG: Rpn family recombination-promoting nuclease/putative transposase [Lachnoclostridium sp.]